MVCPRDMLVTTPSAHPANSLDKSGITHEDKASTNPGNKEKAKARKNEETRSKQGRIQKEKNINTNTHTHKHTHTHTNTHKQQTHTHTPTHAHAHTHTRARVRKGKDSQKSGKELSNRKGGNVKVANQSVSMASLPETPARLKSKPKAETTFARSCHACQRYTLNNQAGKKDISTEATQLASDTGREAYACQQFGVAGVLRGNTIRGNTTRNSEENGTLRGSLRGPLKNL